MGINIGEKHSADSEALFCETGHCSNALYHCPFDPLVQMQLAFLFGHNGRVITLSKSQYFQTQIYINIFHPTDE